MEQPHHDLTPPPHPMPTPAHRYPLAPLAHALGITLHTIGGHQPGQPPTGITALAQATGYSPRWLQHLHQHGLTDTQADHLAITTGHHPATIWPTWLTDLDPNEPDLPEQPTLFNTDIA